VSRIVLVRHGQSTWNAVGRWQGRADPPLSELGERQADDAAAAELLGPVAVAWSSPLDRACATATRIADRLGLTVTVDERLAERDAGEWTGLTRDEIEAGWPGYLADRRRPPAFEADDELASRALEVLHEIAAHAAGSTVLAVSHGGLIRSVERALGADSPPVPNLGGRELVGSAGGLVLGDRVLLVDAAGVDVTTPGQI
jgi:broad specificity phosphatase PhoE